MSTKRDEADKSRQQEEHGIDLREREYERRKAMVLATAWRDPEFMKRLTSEPRVCFGQFGIKLPENRTVIVHFDTETELHIVIPPKPPDFGDPLVMDADKCWKSSKCWNLCD
jgi:hypothetical protein